jgi:hypothetical protein
VIELQRRAGTHGSFTEASRNTRLNYRGEQEHIAHLQRRSGRHGSSTGERSYRRERNNVAQLFRRSGTLGSSTHESRNTWLSNKKRAGPPVSAGDQDRTEESSTSWLSSRGEQKHVARLQSRAGTCGSSIQKIRNPCFGYRGEQEHLD